MFLLEQPVAKAIAELAGFSWTAKMRDNPSEHAFVISLEHTERGLSGMTGVIEPQKFLHKSADRSGGLATLDPDTWFSKGRPEFYRLMYAASAALIACARLKFPTITDLTLADYDADTLEFKSRGGRGRYPIILLPVVVAAIERYLAKRRPLGGTPLFVGEDGNKLSQSTFENAFASMGRVHGLDGRSDVKERLIGYFDWSFNKVQYDDDAAVLALKHGVHGDLARLVPRRQVRDAIADRERLKVVLTANHPLAGPPGRWLGGHGKAKIAEESRLFQQPRYTVTISPFMRSDKVCAELLARDWSSCCGRAQNAAPGSKPSGRKDRKNEANKHFPYLKSLLDEELINIPQFAHLLNYHPTYLKRLLTQDKLAKETPEDRDKRIATERFWDAEAERLYRERPDRKESLTPFFARLQAAGYPFGWGRLTLKLGKAGLTQRQVAKRQGKKVTSGNRQKSENRRPRYEKRTRTGV